MGRLTILIALLALVPAAAQDADTEEPAEPAAAEDAAEEEVTDEEIEALLGLDEDYTEIEDDFDPTEEVRFEQSIPFPVDI